MTSEVNQACEQSAWFCALGEPLNAGEQATLRSYLRGLGKDGAAPIKVVAGWGEARRVSADPRWDHSLWHAEQLERKRLLAVLPASFAGAALEAISDRLHGCAAVAAARMGCADQGLIRAAAGAATEAVYLAALARAAGVGNEHPFACKLALFESGHWPLLLIDDNYYLF